LLNIWSKDCSANWILQFCGGRLLGGCEISDAGCVVAVCEAVVVLQTGVYGLVEGDKRYLCEGSDAG
jgi:hypothetical protein